MRTHTGAVLCVTVLFLCVCVQSRWWLGFPQLYEIAIVDEPLSQSNTHTRTRAHPLHPLPAPIRQERLRILVERAHIHPTIAAALVSSFRVAAYLRNKAQYHYYREREDMYRYVPFLLWKGFRGTGCRTTRGLTLLGASGQLGSVFLPPSFPIAAGAFTVPPPPAPIALQASP